eukprot:4571566-Amphidinium_carterae.1
MTLLVGNSFIFCAFFVNSSKANSRERRWRLSDVRNDRLCLVAGMGNGYFGSHSLKRIALGANAVDVALP